MPPYFCAWLFVLNWFIDDSKFWFNGVYEPSYEYIQGGKYRYIYYPDNFDVSDGRFNYELTRVELFLRFIIHTTAIIKANNNIPPKTPITITNTLTELVCT